jgi:hypothetical protein
VSLRLGAAANARTLARAGAAPAAHRATRPLMESTYLFALVRLTVIAFIFARVTDGWLRLFDFALDEGHLLSPWFLFIKRLEPSHPNLFKMLGGCVVCSGFWLSLILFAVYCYNDFLSYSVPVLVFYQSFVMSRLVARVRKQQARQAELAPQVEVTSTPLSFYTDNLP